MPGSSLSPDEERLAKDWKINDNMAPSKIAGLLRRDKSTITRLLKRTVPRKKRGSKLMLIEAQVEALVAKMKEMIAKANGRWEVTVAMLKKSCAPHLSSAASGEWVQRRMPALLGVLTPHSAWFSCCQRTLEPQQLFRGAS